jgi:hypothetical protein
MALMLDQIRRISSATNPLGPLPCSLGFGGTVAAGMGEGIGLQAFRLDLCGAGTADAGRWLEWLAVEDGLDCRPVQKFHPLICGVDLVQSHHPPVNDADIVDQRHFARKI